MKKIRLIIASGLLFLVFISAYSYHDPIKIKIDSLMSKHYPSQGAGAVVLVIKDGQPFFSAAYGKADLELDVPLTTESVLRIGSVTKQFTAVSILMLVKEGKLSLDDRVTKYYPQLYSDRVITIRHLLSHTSGIKDFAKIQAIRAMSNQYVAPDQMIDIFAKEPLEFDPGSQYSYSNSGYIILGAILEKVNGISYEDFLKERIFEPLSMTHTCYCDNTTIVPGRVSGYFSRPTGFVHPLIINNSILFSAGGILSTVDDMAKWDAALYSGKILDRKTLELAFTPNSLNSGELTDYGFGFRESQVNGMKSIEHGGGAVGFNAYAIRLESEKIYVIILSNFEGGNKYDELAAVIAALAANKPYHHKAVKLESNVLQKLPGSYAVAENDTLKISLEKENLFLQRNKGSKQKLIPLSRAEFLIEGTVDDRIRFFEKNKKIESLLFKKRRAMAVIAQRVIVNVIRS